MERLTEENSVGVYVFKSNYSCERCGEEFCRLPDLGNGSPTDKLAEYEIMEQKLESVYGKCDGLLETVVDHLVKHPEIEIGKTTKARLLTDEDVDKWERYKKLEEQGDLNKQDPILVVKVYDKYQTKYFCPICNKQQKESRKNWNKGCYCERCGQKLLPFKDYNKEQKKGE